MAELKPAGALDLFARPCRAASATRLVSGPVDVGSVCHLGGAISGHRKGQDLGAPENSWVKSHKPVNTSGKREEQRLEEDRHEHDHARKGKHESVGAELMGFARVG